MLIILFYLAKETNDKSDLFCKLANCVGHFIGINGISWGIDLNKNKIK